MNRKDRVDSYKKNIVIAITLVLAVIILFIVDIFDYGYGFILLFLRFCLYIIIFYNVLTILIMHEKLRKTAALLKKIILIGSAVWLATFMFVLGLIVLNSGSDELSAPQYVIVEGAGLRGKSPSKILKGRLDAALDILKKYPDCKAVLCGGQAPNEVISEAEAMYRYFINAGIDEWRLIKEEQSRDTAENISNAKKIMLNDSGEVRGEIVISTSGFHMYRSKLLAEKNGFEALGVSSCNRVEYFRFYLREYFSLAIYLVELTGIKLDTSAWGF